MKFHYSDRGDPGNIKSHLSLEKWDLDVQAAYATPRVYDQWIFGKIRLSERILAN
jgi:hypothetical protein